MITARVEHTTQMRAGASVLFVIHLDSHLNIVKNMDDFLLYGRNLKEELKVKDEVGSQVEFGGSVLTAEKRMKS